MQGILRISKSLTWLAQKPVTKKDLFIEMSLYHNIVCKNILFQCTLLGEIRRLIT
jgi:hypothetical protein